MISIESWKLRANMKPGDEVEVWQICAGGRKPLYHWSKGYVFHKKEDTDIILKITKGTFVDCYVRYDFRDVRKYNGRRA